MVVFPLGFLLGRLPEVDPEVFHPDQLRIRCPNCGWEPSRSDTWMCSPGCGHLWNTFETRGVCPACSKEWAHTACPRCGVWSPHESWYERSA